MRWNSKQQTIHNSICVKRIFITKTFIFFVPVGCSWTLYRMRKVLSVFYRDRSFIFGHIYVWILFINEKLWRIWNYFANPCDNFHRSEQFWNIIKAKVLSWFELWCEAKVIGIGKVWDSTTNSRFVSSTLFCFTFKDEVFLILIRSLQRKYLPWNMNFKSLFFECVVFQHPPNNNSS